ncbi:hypothetical protein SAMN04489761_3998 [Tenacibaculum sp. MAR_2009_124]|uniref:hypothetical protein n=1 Tax=Tenacibaculum sp. MAR_2009_124 TaxID=1250059 RepID=UPI00089D763B|nr:hypothetical protein [Tenacibaculum sp. MAR_2009_124]SEC93022.1 hypothetical protein SAMN04489761_3998 [Tenacibaculum sp. MAR_2009_124]
MKKFLLIIALFSLTNLFSQDLKKEAIEGVWKVEEVKRSSKKSNSKELIDGFKGAYFYFKKSNNFGIKTTHMSETFSDAIKVLRGAQWKVKGNEVHIGTEKNEFKAMIIKVESTKNEFYFDLGEGKQSALVLKVEKQ